MIVSATETPAELHYPTIPADGQYGGDASAGENRRAPIHRWVPWIAGFSGQFVRDVIETYLPERRRSQALVLDPFAGVATTLVEALKAGCPTIGYEINPFAALAGAVKVGCVDLSISALETEISALHRSLRDFEAHVDGLWSMGGDNSVAPLLENLRVDGPRHFRSRIPFFSPPVEAKVLHTLGEIRRLPEPNRSFFLVALGAQLVSISNYSYEPSLSSRPGAGKPLIPNASVLAALSSKLGEMLADATWVQSNYRDVWPLCQRRVVSGSYLESNLKPKSVSLVVTSPPYMNNYHYARNTRPHLHWLGLVRGQDEPRRLEHESFGKFWQTVRQAQPVHLTFEYPELCAAVEDLRGLSTEKGAYGGPGWANYVATYLNDSWRFLGVLGPQLEPEGRAVIVIGNSIIQGMEFKVDQLLAQMAERRGLRADVRVLRTKRVGNSIVNSSVRNGAKVNRNSTQLYDAAVLLKPVNR